jgi:very-short-patch-repair endonuclease
MVWSTAQTSSSAVWKLAAAQHGVVSRRQLLKLGLSRRTIEHRLATRRLHRVMRGVYAIGRPELTRRGHWMAAVLSCEPAAVLSHRSAAALWGIGIEPAGRIEISVRALSYPRGPGVLAHRRPTLRPEDLDTSNGIPVTTPVRTLIDLATQLGKGSLERAINEADRLELVDPETLLAALDEYPGVPGVGPLRAILGERTFRLTDSELERRFLSLIAAAGMPTPVTGIRLNGFKVDFYWPDLGLVVETDGLRYHRTPGQQARDRLRDQAHTAAGLTPLRFTHAQVRFDAAHVRAILAETARRLRAVTGLAARGWDRGSAP